ncbi:MAG: hypothetical protein DSM106950_40040 [Stigonema ocellatum SAG 48.90 = DSM 106950]|nr:hypothetical protein [Stigonema ocellatum SAG 48.90 = DSM 106950]
MTMELTVFMFSHDLVDDQQVLYKIKRNISVSTYSDRTTKQRERLGYINSKFKSTTNLALVWFPTRSS